MLSQKFQSSVSMSVKKHKKKVDAKERKDDLLQIINKQINENRRRPRGFDQGLTLDTEHMSRYDALFAKQLQKSHKVVKEQFEQDKARRGDKLEEYALKRLGELEERVTEEFYRKEPTMQGMMGEANKG